MSQLPLFRDDRPAWEIDFDRELAWVDVEKEFGLEKEKLRQILHKLYEWKVIR